jgi:hypothetical protein
MNEKSINEVVKEFKEAFGLVDFKAVNNETGQVVQSKGYVPTILPRLEIDGTDYIALGQLNARHAAPTVGVITHLLKLVK